jgi:Protein of unknown function (DUF1722)
VTVKTHVDNTLRARLARRDQDELHGTIADHRRELVLYRPLTPLRHDVARLGLGDLRGQVYLEPHPKELMLLDHVWRRNADSARTWRRPNCAYQPSGSITDRGAAALDPNRS